MAALEWDATGERWYENGVDHVVLYKQTSAGAYGTGVAWNGITGITESPDGAEPTDLWADNMKYATLRSTETFGFTITAYQNPVEFEECDGSLEVAKGVYAGQQARTGFGLAYRSQLGNDTQTESDDGYKLHLVYGATASPSERSRETINDSPDAAELSWECTTTPVTMAGYKATSHLVIDSRYADATKLATLEKKLFGDTTSEPTLLLPAEVITMMGVVDTSSVTGD